MDKRTYRRFTAEEQRTILDETQQPGVTLAEVCRKHNVNPGLVVDRWRAVAQQATTESLHKVDSRGKSHPDAHTARLEAELERMRRGVAEITAETLELKKTRGLVGRVRLSAQQKQEVMDLVELTQRRSEWPLEPMLACLGVPSSVYFAWRTRAQRGQLADLPRGPASYDRLLPDEVEAIKAFALRYPKTGYRKLTYSALPSYCSIQCCLNNSECRSVEPGR